MAKMHIVAVWDRAADAFMNPFVVPSLGLAIRSFQDEINRPEGDMFKHPDDFDLYHLGLFDQDTGTFEVEKGLPKQLSIGKQLSTKLKVA